MTIEQYNNFLIYRIADLSLKCPNERTVVYDAPPLVHPFTDSKTQDERLYQHRKFGKFTRHTEEGCSQTLGCNNPMGQDNEKNEQFSVLILGRGPVPRCPGTTFHIDTFTKCMSNSTARIWITLCSHTPGHNIPLRQEKERNEQFRGKSSEDGAFPDVRSQHSHATGKGKE